MAGGGEEEEYSEWQQTGGKWLQKRRLHQVLVAGCVGRGGGGGDVGGGGDAQFANAITVDSPSPSAESNQHYGRNSSV